MDADGRLRTMPRLAGMRAVCAVRRMATLLSGGVSSTAEGAGLNAQEHRQDHKRPSGVELGTGPYA